MNIYSSKEIIKIIKKDGWYLVSAKGSHHHFKHPTKQGRVTIPHPYKEIAPGTLKSILNQAQIKLES